MIAGDSTQRTGMKLSINSKEKMVPRISAARTKLGRKISAALISLSVSTLILQPPSSLKTTRVASRADREVQGDVEESDSFKKCCPDPDRYYNMG